MCTGPRACSWLLCTCAIRTWRRGLHHYFHKCTAGRRQIRLSNLIGRTQSWIQQWGRLHIDSPGLDRDSHRMHQGSQFIYISSSSCRVKHEDTVNSPSRFLSPGQSARVSDTQSRWVHLVLSPAARSTAASTAASAVLHHFSLRCEYSSALCSV